MNFTDTHEMNIIRNIHSSFDIHMNKLKTRKLPKKELRMAPTVQKILFLTNKGTLTCHLYDSNCIYLESNYFVLKL